jgi:predicted methyltransferase
MVTIIREMKMEGIVKPAETGIATLPNLNEIVKEKAIKLKSNIQCW